MDKLNHKRNHRVSPSSFDCSTQQAQTYFAGQSRYIGVYESSRLAARAYVVVQDFLRQYRTSCRIAKDTPREALAAVFATARQVADDAVRHLSNADDESISNVSAPSPEKNGTSSDGKRKVSVAVSSSAKKVREISEPESQSISEVTVSATTEDSNSNTGSLENAVSKTDVIDKTQHEQEKAN
jgi:hypothetical protein